MNLSSDLFAAQGHQIALLQASCRLLEQELDTPFSVWVSDGDGFIPIDSEIEIEKSQKAAWGKLVAVAVQQDELSCLELDENRWLIVATLMNVTTGARIVAAVVGMVETTDHVLLKRLVQCVLKRAEQERELQDVQTHLNEFADQVTNDFEELTWLRSLTEHIEVCDLRNDLAAVSEAVLPPLRELIDAEAVVLFTPPVPTPLDQPSSAEDATFVAGELPVSVDVCRRVIQQSREGMRDQPLVRNNAAAANNGQELRNFILVRIARSGKHYGWLLVTNRRILDGGLCSEPVNASCLQEWEFGTFEAGLLNAASIMLGSHARNAELFGDKEQLLVGVMRTLINAIDAKDAYTCGHSDRVALFASKIAKAMNLDAIECQRIYMAGLLHDIGKIGVPDGVLCKPGKLTDEEFEQIKAHPEIGYSILKHVKQLEYVLPGVLHHHESLDGSGYPHRLKGDEIPLYGRILAVADAYDAMTSTRSYRKAMPTEKAEEIIQRGSGIQWDPPIVEAFLSVIDEVRAVSQKLTTENLVDEGGKPHGDLDPEALDAIYQAVNTMANA